MQTIKRPYMLLLVLALVFALPGIAAYMLFQHPYWMGQARTNKGRLLTSNDALPVPSNHKWRLVLWQPATCDASCRAQLDTLARVRLALGRRLYQVEVLLVLGHKALPLTSRDMAIFKDTDIQTAVLSSHVPKALAQHAEIFLVTPDNHLLLAYTLPVTPADVYADLGHLLRTSDKKNA